MASSTSAYTTNVAASSPRTPNPIPRSYFHSPATDQFVSGLSAGFVSTVLLHPFDLIKTRLQVQGFDPLRAVAIATPAGATSGGPVPSVAASKVYRSSLHAARSLLKHEGPSALYKGISPNLVGNTVAWGLYFYGYDLVKRWLSTHSPFTLVRLVSHPSELHEDGRRPLNALEHILAASITGTCVSAMTNPLWVVKTRMFLDRSPPDALHKLPPEARAKLERTGVQQGQIAYRGLMDALQSIYRTEGMAGLYRGFVPGLFGVSHGAVQFMCYEELKKARLGYKSHHSASSLDTQKVEWSAAETIVMSFASKAFAAAATYPYQVLRSRMQSSPTHLTVRGVVSSTWRAEGIVGFYRGFWVNLVKVMPAACTVFVVYEQASAYMKRHATYEHPT